MRPALLLFLLLQLVVCSREDKKLQKISSLCDSNNIAEAVNIYSTLDVKKVTPKIFCSKILSITKVFRFLDQEDEEFRVKLFDTAIEILSKCKSNDHLTTGLLLIQKNCNLCSADKKTKVFDVISKSSHVSPDYLILVKLMLFPDGSVVQIAENRNVQPLGKFYLAVEESNYKGMLDALHEIKAVFGAENNAFSYTLKLYLVILFVSNNVHREADKSSVMNLVSNLIIESEWVKAIIENYDTPCPGFQSLAQFITKNELEARSAWMVVGNFFFNCIESLEDTDEITKHVKMYYSLNSSNTVCLQRKLNPVFNYLLRCGDGEASILPRRIILKEFAEKIDNFKVMFDDRYKIDSAQFLVENLPSKISRSELDERLGLNNLQSNSLEFFKINIEKIDKAMLKAKFLLGNSITIFILDSILRMDLDILYSVRNLSLQKVKDTPYEEITLTISIVINLLNEDEFANEPWLMRRFHGANVKCKSALSDVLSKSFWSPDAKLLRLFVLYYCQSDKFQSHYASFMSDESKSETATSLANVFNDLNNHRMTENITVSRHIVISMPTFMNHFVQLELGASGNELEFSYDDVFARFPNSVFIVYYWLKYLEVSGQSATAINLEHSVKLISNQTVTFQRKFHTEMVFIVDKILSHDSSYAKHLCSLLPLRIQLDSELADVLVQEEDNKDFVLDKLTSKSKFSFHLLKKLVGKRKEWIIDPVQLSTKLKLQSSQSILEATFPEHFPKSSIQYVEKNYYDYVPPTSKKKRTLKNKLVNQDVPVILQKEQEEESQSPISFVAHESLKENEKFDRIAPKAVETITESFENRNWNILQTSTTSNIRIYYLDGIFIDTVPHRLFFDIDRNRRVVRFLLLEMRNCCYDRIAIARALSHSLH